MSTGYGIRVNGECPNIWFDDEKIARNTILINEANDRTMHRNEIAQMVQMTGLTEEQVKAQLPPLPKYELDIAVGDGTNVIDLGDGEII